MDIYAKGQLSFLILNCLLERDFYGLDIISEISQRSNGRINLKKPSVYSIALQKKEEIHIKILKKSLNVTTSTCLEILMRLIWWKSL